MSSRCKAAVNWMCDAPPGEKRTQRQAAERFGIDQSVISRALRRHVAADDRPDNRVKRRYIQLQELIDHE
jgi:hypothetical protein